MIGQAIGPYVVERELGSGPLGAVFAARDPRDGREVAVKLLAQGVLDPRLYEQFVAEMQGLKGLAHDHVLAVRDAGLANERPFLVTEFVGGGSLRGLLKRFGDGATMPLALGLELLRQAAEGLAYAHQQGLVHHDLKPENLLLVRTSDPQGGPPRFTVKISDLGVAPLVQAGAQTGTGRPAVGTPHYLAPEQCLGLPANSRADIYALGVILYEVATGLVPFSGATPEAIAEKHLKAAVPPLRGQRPDLPLAVEQIVLRCLEKDPAKRYQKAEELAAALRAAGGRLVTAPPTPPDLEGATAVQRDSRSIGPYRIEGELPDGSGGMGEVFRARDSRTNKLVALKILYPNLTANPKVRERFLSREVPIAKQLRHRHIVEMYEAGEADGRLYMAMELVGGGSLRGLLDRRAERPWPLRLGLELVAQAAEGLAYAHDQGVIHRDIKPENLLLAQRAVPRSDAALLTSLLNESALEAEYTLKLSDFGVATFNDGSRLTSTGTPVGTHIYMSPEQCTGRQVDARTDIYALGVVLYEIATGAMPFAADNPTVAIYQILLTTPPPPRSLNPSLPAAIEAIILRCMARDPNDRYHSARALLDDLRSAISNLGLEAITESAPPPPAAIERSSEEIFVALEPSTLTLIPGTTSYLTVTVRNLSQQVDHLKVSIHKVPPGWVKPASALVQLLPSNNTSVTFAITVPREPGSLAGHYNVMVRAESQHVKVGDVGIAHGHWTVEPFADTQLDVRPKEVISRSLGAYKIQVTNGGNAATAYTLGVKDDLGTLGYHFDPDDQPDDDLYRFVVEPGKSAHIRVIARAPHYWVGPTRRHNLDLTLHGAADEPEHGRTLTFHQPPRIPTWAVGLLTSLAVIMCMAGGVFAYSRLFEAPRSEAAAAAATARAETATVAWLQSDDDSDGLTNQQERQLKTLPDNRDTDQDGRSDGEEVNGKPQTNPLVADTDSDGLKDGDEIRFSTDPLNPDTDGDGIRDNIDPDALKGPTSTPPPTFTPSATPTATPSATTSATATTTASPTTSATATVTHPPSSGGGGPLPGVTPPTATSTDTTEPVVPTTATPSPTPTPIVAVDFITLAPQAIWESGQLAPEGTPIPYPTPFPWGTPVPATEGEARIDTVVLENDSSTPALYTRPPDLPNGVIAGRFPAQTIQAGDTFAADVGFAKDANSTDGVTFQVIARRGEEVIPLCEITKLYDGTLQPLDCTLDGAIGQEVVIELWVKAGETATGDQAAWINLRVLRQAGEQR